MEIVFVLLNLTLYLMVGIAVLYLAKLVTKFLEETVFQFVQ